MKKQLTNYYFLFIAVFISYLLTVQIRSNVVPYQGIVTIPKILEMKNEIENITNESLKLASSISEAQLKLRGYETSINTTGNVLENMKQELEAARSFADFEKMEGPGIIITMNDSLTEISAEENLNWYLIHNSDILEIINELRDAGAEAISINGERVTATSTIRCGGPTINIDGKRHAVPFVIKAIGDPQKLEASATAPSGYIDLMEYYDIRIDVQKVDKLIINAYDGEYKLNYQKKTEDGE
ncbi:MAG: hypothetical protein A2Y23_14855 [Clostridiales bacterium GWB2_37_7]|nr:MAG: hypothetical protein A2Y23_14855 [Clostridiales bacterium GWB2_37_7]